MQDKTPFLSVITPTYNRKKLLEKAILSVIHQKNDIPFEWEMIIIDDGSNDGTREYIEKYLNKYENIKYFYQENAWVWKARNIWLDNLSKKSDYTIMLDSDDELTKDCIYICLKKWRELEWNGKYDNIIWLLFHCITDTGKTIWNMSLVNFDNYLYWYNDFLCNKINWEKWSIIKSNIYLNNQNFRFDEDVINEAILRSKIMKFINIHNMNFLYMNYVWRIYWTQNNENINKITKTISKDRFSKNAIWNERVLEIIWDDLLKYGIQKSYSEYLFRAWVNWILYWEKEKWLTYIKKSLKYKFDLKIFIIFILSILSRRVVLTIYKIYI